jgi:hypothetical protein
MNNFCTANLALAAFLVAGKHLNLERLGVDQSGVAEFMFGDPEGTGLRLEADFLQDAPVPAATFHRQLRVLRRLIQEKQSRSKQHNSNSIRGYEYEHSQRRY